MGCCFSREHETRRKKGGDEGDEEFLYGGEYHSLESENARPNVAEKGPHEGGGGGQHAQRRPINGAAQSDTTPLLNSHNGVEGDDHDLQSPRQAQPLDIPRRGSSATKHHHRHQDHTGSIDERPPIHGTQQRRNSLLQFQTKLLDYAEENFIEATEHALVVEKEDPNDPSSKYYIDTLKQTQVDENILDLEVLPEGIHSSQSKTSLAQLFEAPPHASNQQEALEYVASSVKRTVAETSKVSNPYGPLVVYFSDHR
eukprot:gb/GECG01001067.1/.p1 GENE.gb/GECG01001067.1/~~gb/GECG01001067.1/.p1  ORF type:complete len:255 (+),score=40.88 gb/GECG01001067.1/:1-765(+)